METAIVATLIRILGATHSLQYLNGANPILYFPRITLHCRQCHPVGFFKLLVWAGAR